MEQEHKTEQSKLTEYLDKIKRYFPYVEKLLPLFDYCQNTIHFSNTIINELGRFKKVPLKGKSYSSEFDQYFESNHTVFAIKQEKNGTYDLKIDGVSHVSWFRQKMDEWIETMGISRPKQNHNKGVKF